MSENSLSLPPKTGSVLRKFNHEEWVYFLVTLLSLIGVAVTDYAPTQSWVYWFCMVAAFATLAIILEKLQVSRKELPFRKLLITQLIHWGGTMLAVMISFSFVKTGRMTYDGDGLLILLILALATFIDGIHVGWRFYLAGLLLGLTTIFAAYFEQFMWIVIVVAVVCMVFAVRLESYLTTETSSAPDR